MEAQLYHTRHLRHIDGGTAVSNVDSYALNRCMQRVEMGSIHLPPTPRRCFIY